MVCSRACIVVVVGLVDANCCFEDCWVADGGGGDGECVRVQGGCEGLAEDAGEGAEIVFEL